MLQKNPLSASESVMHELEAGEAGTPLTQTELWDALTRTFKSPRYQPPMLPPVATELLALSSKPDVEVGQIVQLLERDSLLAGRVLKLANSPLYGAVEPLRTLKTAVVRMGLAELRDLVLEASMSSRVFKTTGYSEAVDRVRLHSAAVAHVARAITRFTSFESEYAFLCGLLHDVGYSAALVALGDVPRGQKLRPVSDLWSALDPLHATVGSSVVTVWKLPTEIATVLRIHHTLKVGNVVHPVAAILVLAESLADEFGFGLVPQRRLVHGAAVPSLLFGAHRPDAPLPEHVLQARQALGFEGAELDRVRAAAAKVLEQLKRV